MVHILVGTSHRPLWESKVVGYYPHEPYRSPWIKGIWRLISPASEKKNWPRNKFSCIKFWSFRTNFTRACLVLSQVIFLGSIFYFFIHKLRSLLVKLIGSLLFKDICNSWGTKCHRTLKETNFLYKKTPNTLINIKGNLYNKILLKYGNSFIERHLWVLMHLYHLFQEYTGCSFKRHIYSPFFYIFSLFLL